MFKFIHKRAIKIYKGEIESFIDNLSRLNQEELSELFIYSVWTRAGLQNEGFFVFPDGSTNLSPQLTAYPIMIEQFDCPIKHLRKKGRNTEAAFLSIWVHTLRGLLNSELSSEVDRLWVILMTTKNSWEKYLNKFYTEDISSGVDPKLCEKTQALSKEILKYLPPKHSWKYEK